MSVSRFRVVTFRCGVSPERKVRGVTTVSAFDSITATRCGACDCQGSTAIFLNRSIAAAGSPFSFSKIEAIGNWACAAGSLPGNLLSERLPGGDRLVVLLLGDEALADLEEDLRHAARRAGSAATNACQAARASAYCSAAQVVGGDQELGVEDRPLGVGRLRPVGELGEVALPGGDRLVELLLPLEDLADLERSRSSTSSARSRFASSVSARKPSSLRNASKRLERLLALAAGEVRRADLVGGPDGQRVRRVGREEPPQGGDAEVQARCRRAGWGCRRSWAIS